MLVALFYRCKVSFSDIITVILMLLHIFFCVSVCSFFAWRVMCCSGATVLNMSLLYKDMVIKHCIWVKGHFIARSNLVYMNIWIGNKNHCPNICKGGGITQFPVVAYFMEHFDTCMTDIHNPLVASYTEGIP